jgi:hypothetical protein
MKITNTHAEQEARRLARDYEQHVLGVLTTALIPNKTQRQFLRDAHMSLSEAGTSNFIVRAEYEHVELTCESGDLPDDMIPLMLSEISMTGTADLGHRFTLAAIKESQISRRHELVARAGKLANGRLRRFKSRRKRRVERINHLLDVLDILDGLPATGDVFEDSVRSLLDAIGVARTSDGYVLTDSGEAQALGSFTSDDLDDRYLPEQIEQSAAGNAAALRERWETILAWTYDAIREEVGDSTEDFLLKPHKRFRAAVAAAKLKAEQEAKRWEDRRRLAIEEEGTQRRRRQAEQRARTQAEVDERRSRNIEQLRRNPPRGELDENMEAEKNGGLEPGA